MLKLEQVHTDTRGDIYRILMPGNRELMLFFSKAGHYRGGHSHNCSEMVVLLSGKMRYHKWSNGEEIISTLDAGQVSYNPAGIPHMGFFLEDTWLIDWKLGPDSGIGEWSTTDFEPFRKLVREKMQP